MLLDLFEKHLGDYRQDRDSALGLLKGDARLRLENSAPDGGDIPLELNRELAVLSVADGRRIT